MRAGYNGLLSIPFRESVDADSFGFARAERLMRQEGMGLMVLTTHFSRADPVITMRALQESPIFRG